MVGFLAETAGTMVMFWRRKMILVTSLEICGSGCGNLGMSLCCFFDLTSFKERPLELLLSSLPFHEFRIGDNTSNGTFGKQGMIILTLKGTIHSITEVCMDVLFVS